MRKCTPCTALLYALNFPNTRAQFIDIMLPPISPGCNFVGPVQVLERESYALTCIAASTEIGANQE